MATVLLPKPEENTMQIPGLVQVRNSVESVLTQAERIQVTTSEEMRIAAEHLKGLAAVQKQVEDTFDPPTKSAHATWKALTGLRAKFTDPIDKAIRTLKSKIGQFQMEQERIRREEERKAQEAARKQQEAEAAALAAQLETEGNQVEAEQVLAEAIAAPAPVVVVPSTVPQVEGISGRKSYKYTIVDAEKIPRAYMIPDVKLIGSIVRSKGREAEKMIPGIEVREEMNIAVRA